MSAADWWTAASQGAGSQGAGGTPAGCGQVEPSGRDRSGSGEEWRPVRPLSGGDARLSALFQDACSVSPSRERPVRVHRGSGRRGRSEDGSGGVCRVELDELMELVEKATGMGRMGEVRLAMDRVLGLVRSKWVGAGVVLGSLVVGRKASRGLMVLDLVHRVIMLGPWALTEGLEEGLGITQKVLDVAEEGLSSPGGRFKEGHDADALWPQDDPKICLQLYAKFLRTKLELHRDYPEIEGNYSLDRYYRRVDVENRVDERRKRENAERHSEIFCTGVYDRLERFLGLAIRTAEAMVLHDYRLDMIERICADACNLFALASYFGQKLHDESDRVTRVLREKLRNVLLDAKAKKGEVTPILKRNVERVVIKMIMEAPRRAKAVRPESRFRRDIMCEFTSFETLHEAFAPPAAV